MHYGLFQYYKDELTGWNRIVAFHQEESRELVRKIAIVLNESAESSTFEKKGSSFVNQLIGQQQELDYIFNQITSQQQRLDRTASFPGIPFEYPFCHHQNSLRTRMQCIERKFIRAKYTCSVFLSSFLNDKIMALVVR